MIGYGNSMLLSTHGILARGGTPAASLLLDTYPNAAVAYSLRKLSSTYTGNCIRVRRSSGVPAEQDIGFVNDALDTASLLSFVGAGNGFVTTWYDQSGNANNATQSTAANQPQIVSSGAILTVNSKPCLSLDGTNDVLNLGSSITVSNTNNFNSFVGKRDASSRSLYGLSGGTSQQYIHMLYGGDNKYYLYAKSGNYQISSSADTTTNQLLLTGQNAAGTMSIFKNGTTITSTQQNWNYTNNISNIGNWLGGGYQAFCKLQEIVFYNSDKSSSRTGIESNINTFYTIY